VGVEIGALELSVQIAPPGAPGFGRDDRIGPDIEIMEKIKQLWTWMTTSRYLLHLEEENRQLREDNRGLMNALLYQRNLPAIERAVRGDNKNTAAMPRKLSYHQMQYELDRRAHLEELREDAARAAKETQRWASPTTPVR
jgi:hypothetical protein